MVRDLFLAPAQALAKCRTLSKQPLKESPVANPNFPRYSVFMVSVVNCEEFIGKTVGRRQFPADAMTHADGLQRTMGKLTHLRIKRGVYKFNSHEEADQWLMDRLIRKPGN